MQNNDGWDNDWADDNAANWFDNDNNQAAQVVDSGADDQLLQQKEEECLPVKGGTFTVSTYPCQAPDQP